MVPSGSMAKLTCLPRVRTQKTCQKVFPGLSLSQSKLEGSRWPNDDRLTVVISEQAARQTSLPWPWSLLRVAPGTHSTPRGRGSRACPSQWS
jgi:hypothetical protein